MWDLSCPDWEERLRAGRSLIPALPLTAEADIGLAFFDEFQLPDVPDRPRLGEAAGPWFRDLVRAAFGSWDPSTGLRYIRDIFCLAPKAQSKTSYAAGLMLAVMLMNRRWNAEALFVGPTQSISDRAYDQAAGMIEISPALKRRFQTIDHAKTIRDRINRSEMRVKTFDASVLTGAILIFALLDELHLLGKSVHTTKVLRQVRGGLDKTPEGLLLITTTQSDEQPAGAFADELVAARKIRDGFYRGVEIRPMLPVLYEFPTEIAANPVRWQDPANWPMVLPNLGRSVHLRDLVPSWETEKQKGEHATRIWASQHLNIEIGVGIGFKSWIGTRYWERRIDAELTLDRLLERSEVVVVGIDGGGLDDLFGLAVLGRCRTTKHWLLWSHAWCHKGVLDARKSIASRLLDFERDAELTIVDDELDDLSAIIAIVESIKRRGLLAGVGVDPAGIGEMVDALADIEVTQENKLLVGIGQGYRMMNAIKTAERRLANGTLWHGGSSLMAWCVGNLKIEPTATAIRATKQNAGDAKIDPAMAMFDAIDLMALSPETQRSVYEERGLLVV